MTIRDSIFLQASQSEAFALITDIEKRSQFIPELEEILYPEGKELKAGMNYIEVSSIGGRKIKTRYEVIGLEQDKYIAVRTIEAIFPIQVILLITSQGEKVMLSIELKAEFIGFYKLVAPVITVIIRERTKKILQNIKSVLENPSPNPN